MPAKIAEIRKANKPAAGYLCNAKSDNRYGIDFIEFQIKNVDTGDIYFQFQKEPYTFLPQSDDDNSVRFVQYCLPKAFLECKTISTRVRFCVGAEPVSNLKMLERFYFRDRLLKDYDFDFGFCIPNSTNEAEFTYDTPKISPSDIAMMVAEPWSTRSDSYYFVDDVLIMHNKAEYQFNE
eukprot:Clim_evm70s77 gene=Clim_evmTU70s77